MSVSLDMTYIGGPTALIEFGGVRLLTDPTFDPAESEYKTNIYTLRKTKGPAVNGSSIGRINAVLLSHDHHFDNLDRSGREILTLAENVITTEAGAERLGGNAKALLPWRHIELMSPDGCSVRVTGAPARHGPPTGDRGPVIGFVLTMPNSTDAVYVSGDTVYYQGVVDVAGRFDVKLAILFMGAARVPEVGPDHLTFTAEEGVDTARLFPNAKIVPLHYEGWRHFSESRKEIDEVFRAVGIEKRLEWLMPGQLKRFEF